MNTTTQTSAMPLWAWGTIAAGLAWNIYGVVQFSGSLTATADSLMAMGMTASQAAAYASIPVWMTIAFAIGVFGGVIGCLALALRRAVASTIFTASLVGYGVLYIGDITQGIFAALGAPQIIVLTAVVAIATGLLWLSRHLRATGRLG